MSDKDPSEEKKRHPYARSAKEIRASVMRRAWRGETKLEPAVLMEEILTRKRAATQLPAGLGHEIGLRDVIPGQEYKVGQQNTRNFLNGVNLRFSGTDSPDTDKTAAIQELGDYKNTEIYKIFQKDIVEAERLWREQNPDTGRPELLLEILRQLEEEDGDSPAPEPKKPNVFRIH